MSIYYPFETLHRSLSSATTTDLSDIKYQVTIYRKPKSEKNEKCERTRRPGLSDIEIYMFPQTWSDTTLGFGGVGGQAFTTAYTVVVHCFELQEYVIYHGGIFAYKIDMNTISRKGFDIFMNDLNSHSVVGFLDKNKYFV